MNCRHAVFALLLLSSFASGCAHAATPEAAWFKVDRRVVDLESIQLTSPITILHLSDLHAPESASYEMVEKAFRLGVRQKPDLICLTGDYVNTQIVDAPRYRRAFEILSQSAPTFACFGNHEAGRVFGEWGTERLEEMKKLLRDSGITYLLNEWQIVTVRGQRLRLVGVGDLYSGEFEPSASLFGERVNRAVPIILLCHNPDGKDEMKQYRWDLMLAGHTHGGQVNIPFYGTPSVPVKDKRFIKGLHRWEGRWLYITSGVGSHHGLRINCRPEVGVLQLK